MYCITSVFIYILYKYRMLLRGLNFKTNVEVVLFKWENLIKTIWWLSLTSIACGNDPLWDAIVPLSATPTLIDWPFAKHRNSLSFGTHRWCFLTSTINDTSAYIRKRIFHLGKGCLYLYFFFIFLYKYRIFQFNWNMFNAILF